MSNFDFLQTFWPELADMGRKAERFLYCEPNSSVIEMEKIAEDIAATIISEENISLAKKKDAQLERIEALKNANKLCPEIESIFYRLKQSKVAVYSDQIDMSVEETQMLLRDTFNLACWFYSFYDNNARFPSFVMPMKGNSPFFNMDSVYDLGAQIRNSSEKKKRSKASSLKIAMAVLTAFLILSVSLNIYLLYEYSFI